MIMPTTLKTLPIDLNLDAGESLQSLNDGTEELLYQQITSVNIACGGHTGDRETMTKAVALALKYGLKIGAHPSFPDRENFGRKKIEISKQALLDSLVSQIDSLKTICTEQGASLLHVKPHGALYILAAMDLELATVVISAVQKIDHSLKIVAFAGSPFLRWCAENQMDCLAEAFADRRYESDGQLRSREFSDAVISDPLLAAKQAIQLVRDKTVMTSDQKLLKLHAQTICIHGDTKKALEIAKQIRFALET